MGKEELLKEVYEALANENEIKKVKVKYQNGDVINFDFEEAEEDEEDDDEEDDDEEDEEDDDADGEDDEEDEEDHVEDNGTSTNIQTSSQVFQPAGRKVNVINRP